MKECPECKEIVGDNVTTCFNCRYDFRLNRVISLEEIRKEEEKKQKEDEIKHAEKMRVEEHAKALLQLREQTIKKNAFYEYEIEVISDLSNGSTDQMKISECLKTYANEGWRLHSIYTNEIGKSSTTISISGLGGNINSTIDETVIVFERMIKQSDF